jgi:hypothetical protein
MTITVAAERVQETAYSVYPDVQNRKNPETIDRYEMPWWSFLQSHKKTSGNANGTTTVKLKHGGGLELQFWSRRDPLGFGESSIDLQLLFPFTNAHLGLEMVHDDLFADGYDVVANAQRGKGFAKKLSEDEANRLIDIVEEKLEDLMDTWDVQMDLTFLRDGSYDTKAPVGLDGLLPMNNTSGTIGGQSRSNPLLQHTVKSGLTASASGTLRAGMIQAQREANRNGRGRGGRVDFIMAGSSFIDAYQDFSYKNGAIVNTDLGGNRKVDIGLPDTGLSFNGIPIVWNPTFDVLDTLEAPSVPWKKRAYMLNSKVWRLCHTGSNDKRFSAPMDPSDQRYTRLSLDGRYCLICMCPNANSICSIA